MCCQAKGGGKEDPGKDKVEEKENDSNDGRGEEKRVLVFWIQGHTEADAVIAYTNGQVDRKRQKCESLSNEAKGDDKGIHV